MKSRNQVNILIVDDDIVCRVTRAMLNAVGFTDSYSVNTSVQMFQYLDQIHPDVILLAGSLPDDESNIHQILTDLDKRNASYNIICTSCAEKSDSPLIKAYMPKPFKIETLARTIDNLLSQ